MERIFGAGAFERKVPGSKPGKEASVRYVSFDDPASIPKLFYEVLNKMEPKLVNSGGAVLEGTKLELPDGKVRAAGFKPPACGGGGGAAHYRHTPVGGKRR
jgi:hypothetical protein